METSGQIFSTPVVVGQLREPTLLFMHNYRAFPWVLKVFEVSAYHFYKLIEVVIKVESNFPRSIIKHLNRVSQQAKAKSLGVWYVSCGTR